MYIPQIGSPDDDLLIGTDGADQLVGLDGNDTLIGYPGDDSLSGGFGDDSLNGTIGNDTLYGGPGNDTLRGDMGELSFIGGPGDDSLSTGGTARMTAYFGRGDGRDSIAGRPDWASSHDVLQFMGDIQRHDIDVSVAGSALVLSLRGSDDSVTINRFYSTGPASAEGSQIGGAMTAVQEVAFADGTRWTLDDLRNIVFSGTRDDDLIRGSWQADTLRGGSGNDTLRGYDANDILVGSQGDDLLDGGTGNDLMLGGIGDDVYVVDSADDLVFERPADGQDRVEARIDWTLGPNLEDLTLQGATIDLNGTGNALDNVLTGNGGINILSGGAGNDTLRGGAGNDVYRFGRGDGVDHISDIDSTPGNSDALQFTGDIQSEQVWLHRSGQDLVVSLVGSADKVVIDGWYDGSAARVEQLRTPDGRVLSGSSIEALVSAMAWFSPPSAEQGSLPADVSDALVPLIAAHWS